MGAFVAETFADMFAPEKPMEKVRAKETELGRRLTPVEFRDYYQEELDTYGKKVSRVEDWAKLTAATSALLSGQDVGVATFTAITAIENNFLILAKVGVTTACIAYEAYHIHSVYEDYGPIAALTALGIDIGLIYMGGVVLEAATPALRAAVSAALDKMPGLRIALGGLAEKLIIATESLAGTKLGQGIAKVEAGILRGYDKAAGMFGKGPKAGPSSEKGVRFAEEIGLSNYEKIISQIPGHVSHHATTLSPGSLGKTVDSVAATFSGGRYAVITLDEPLIVYRVWTPGQSKELGRFWALEKPAGSLQSCIDSALLPEWGKRKC